MPTFNIDSVEIKNNLLIATASISGSITINSNVTSLGGFTGSLLGTASLTITGATASYVTASNISGVISSASISISASISTVSDYTVYSKHNTSKMYSDLGSSTKYYPLNFSGMHIASSALTINRLYFAAVYIPETTTLTGMKWYRGNTASTTTPNYNGVALYSYSGGTLTLVASSTSDSTMWTQGATSFIYISKSFSSTYTATRGTYFMAFEWGGASGTAPNILTNNYNYSAAQASSLDFTNSAKIYGYVANANATLPSSQAMSGVTGLGSSRPYMILY